MARSAPWSTSDPPNSTNHMVALLAGMGMGQHAPLLPLTNPNVLPPAHAMSIAYLAGYGPSCRLYIHSTPHDGAAPAVYVSLFLYSNFAIIRLERS